MFSIIKYSYPLPFQEQHVPVINSPAKMVAVYRNVGNVMVRRIAMMVPMRIQINAVSNLNLESF